MAGHTDRSLTELGRRQAAELAERLADVELDAVYSSDLLRAVETAEPVASGSGSRFKPPGASRGRRWHLGRADPRRGRGALPRRLSPLERVADGLGGRRDVRRDGRPRRRRNSRLAGEHPGKRILVVSHGGAIRALHAAAAGIDIATFRRLRPVVQNARVTSILVENGRLSEAPGEDLD